MSLKGSMGPFIAKKNEKGYEIVDFLDIGVSFLLR